jgi:sensor domain CHASE-containing protein/HAMP domain-containing protein
MSIRAKVVALVAAMFAILIVMQVVIQERVLMPSFIELERADARTSMTRVRYAFFRNLEALESTASDWSDWGELYQFMQDRNPTFLATYTTPVAMTPLKLNLLMLLDTGGKVAVSIGQDLETGQPLDIDLARGAALPPHFPWRVHLTDGKSARGLLVTNRGVMMLAAAPILDGSGAGRQVGMSLMGRLLTPTQIAAIGRQAQADLSIETRPSIASGQIIDVGQVSEVFQGFDDLDGHRVLTLRVDVPRDITARGHAAVIYSLIDLIGAAIGVCVLLLILLNRLILAPVRRVMHHAVRVGEGADLTAKLGFTGKDEISRLAQEFDRMVDKVAHSRSRLIDRSFHDGVDELTRGVMHNLGNAVTPLMVRMQTLSARLEAAPAVDLVTAAAELARGGANAERRQDLGAFIIASCEAIETEVASAQADLAVIARQCGIIAATLSEQMASTRQDAVLEPVQLPDLVNQTLEIVPDHCRSNLNLSIDESLRSVGTVTVARSVLRLVLQNLIINASQAIRAAGRERGTLRLSALLSGDSAARSLHLCCEDDGIGIAPEHLQRIFEKGFSTKSRAENHGIGLHWCANAVAALGGRIWAVSDGPGRGATLHVVLPLAVRAPSAARLTAAA